VQNIHAYLHEVVGVLRQILKAFLVLNVGEYYCQYSLIQDITNPSTNEAIEIYKMDRNYPRFYRNFLIESDNGRPSLRLLISSFLKFEYITNSPVEKFIIFVKESKGGSEEA
jgi:hypothetical protein